MPTYKLPGQNNLHFVHSRHYGYTINLDLKINNNALPMATHQKVLGLTLDPKVTYNTHIHIISVHAHTTEQIIKTTI